MTPRPRRELIASGAIAAAVLALNIPFAVRGPGFILDDWFTLYFRRFDGVLWSGGHGQLAARPGAWFTYLIEFGLIGAHPLAIFAVQVMLNAAIAVALFRLGRRFLPMTPAVAVASTWIVLQDHSSVDHWASTTPSQVSLLLLLLGGLSLVRAVDQDRAGVLAVVLFVASALSYEATLPVAAVALFAVPWVRTGAVRWRRSTAQLVPLLATGGWMVAHTQHHEHRWFSFSLVYPAHFGWGITPTRHVGQLVGVVFALAIVALVAAFVVGRGGRAQRVVPLLVTGFAVIALGTLAFARDPIDPIALGDRANVVSSLGAAACWAALGLIVWQWRREVASIIVATFVTLSLTARWQRDADYAQAGSDTTTILSAVQRRWPVPPAETIVVGPRPRFHHDVTGLIGELQHATAAYTGNRRYRVVMANDPAAFTKVDPTWRLDYRPLFSVARPVGTATGG